MGTDISTEVSARRDAMLKAIKEAVARYTKETGSIVDSVSWQVVTACADGKVTDVFYWEFRSCESQTWRG